MSTKSGWTRRAGAREPLLKEVVELTAERLRTIAKPNSIALLDALRGGETNVQDLADQLGLSHQITSHHLNLLWRAGILSRRREGTRIFYAIEDWSAWWVIEQMAEHSEHAFLAWRHGKMKL